MEIPCFASPVAERSMFRFEALERRDLLTVPNFVHPDTNPTSDSLGQDISPLDYAGDVSGWYFGRST